MIPMILIVWSLDVFTSFMKCPLHPEWSAPCEIIWLTAAVYWIFLILIIIFAIISSKILRKVKKQIEKEFVESVNNNEPKDGSKKSKTKLLAKDVWKKVAKTSIRTTKKW